ncbi:Phospholipid hydroperoxide glutathione [Globisporangium polare]
MAHSNLDGRVFARLQRFAGLPTDLQNDTKHFQAHVEQDKQKLFQIHHAALVKSVYSVKGKALVDAIVAWLQARDAPPVVEAPVSTEVAAEPVEPVEAAPVAPVVPIEAPQPTEALVETPVEAVAPAPVSTNSTAPPSSTTTAPVVSAETRERARQIAEALVLSGFLTPYKDDEKHLNAVAPDHYVRDNELLIPIAASVAEIKTTSVWNVVDGAVYARALKRKAGVLAPFTQGKDVYVVFNDKTKKAYLFDSDLARAPIAELSGETLNVQFDNAHFEFGVRVSLSSGDEKEKPELFNALSKHLAEEFLNVWLNIGAQYREAYNLHVEDVKSIYELKDVDILGNEVSFDQYQGKVLLIVNVSSKCGLTPTNYPELSALDLKYREQGLVILAFPCNQFASQEPGTNEEIVEFVKQYNAQYAFFEKGDVNGANARPVFTYLKAKLPGTFGSYIKWNFTKFLVDRSGQPVKRFAPQDLPLSFEDAIKEILDQPVPPTAEEVEAEDEAVVKQRADELDHLLHIDDTPTTDLPPLALADVAVEVVETQNTDEQAAKVEEQPAAAQVAPAAT